MGNARNLVHEPAMAEQIDFGIGRPQRLLLSAALSLDKAEAAAALSEWWRGISDLDQVHGTDSGLFAQIYANLGRRIPDPALASRMKGAARHVWVRNNYMISDCARIVAALCEVDIPVMLLKGAAMAIAVDSGNGLRWMSDCDILVPTDKALPAVAALAEAGLTRPQPLDGQDLRLAHGLTLRDQRNGRDRIDVHWQPVRDVGAPSLAREMFAAGVSATIAGEACLVPSFPHMVFHTIVHGTEWSPQPRYDWLVDTVKIVRAAGRGFDWNELERIARTYRFRFLLAAALAEARRHFPDLIPAAVPENLVDGPTPFERREARIRLAKLSSRSRRDELLLAVQKARRASDRALRRPALAVFPAIYRSLYGPPPAADGKGGELTFLNGWSPPEATGRWTEGHLATVALRHTGGRLPDALRLRAHVLLAPYDDPQTVRFHAGFRDLGTLRWFPEKPGPSAQMLPLPAKAWRNGAMLLRLSIGRPVVPAETPGLNPDARALGIFVEDMRLLAEPHDALAADLELTDDTALPFLWHGWSVPEPNGCWTFGERAVLRWRTDGAIPPGHCLLVELTGRAPGPDAITGTFAVDGGRTPFAFAASPPASIALPLALHAPDEEVELAIFIDNPTAPADVIGGQDTRPLGLMIRALRIVPAAASS